MIKPIFYLVIAIFIPLATSAQTGIEAQIGGANFQGMTVNARFTVPIHKSKPIILSPSLGIGIVAPWWDAPTTIVNVGMVYQLRSWGFGTEMSVFTDIPYLKRDVPNDFADIIIYPNFNYTLHKKSSKWYFRLSGGGYFAFSKSERPDRQKYLRFERDVIPGAGIAAGFLISQGRG